MSGGEWVGIVAGVSGFLLAVLAHRQAAKATQARTALDRDKLTWEQYRTLVDDLQSEVARMRKQLHDRDKQFQIAQEQLSAARNENRELREALDRMDRDMQRLLRNDLRPGGRRSTDPPDYAEDGADGAV